MSDNSKKVKRHGMMPFDPKQYQQLQQMAQQEDQQRLDHDDDPDRTVWVYLPFKAGGQDDMRKQAQSFIRERTEENPRAGKKYKLIEHTGGEGQLSGVKPGDTLYIYSHGAERDTNHIYTHDGSQQLSVNGLVNQMIGVEGLDPSKVKIKLGNCYSANVEHQTLDEARSMDTFTSNFTKSISEESLKKGKGMPEYVDGYIGGVQNQNVIVSQDGRRHRGANMPDDDKTAQKIRSLELLKLTTPDKIQEATKLTEPYRAKDNRWRYRPQQTGVTSVQANLDEQEFDRMSQVHETRRQEEARQRQLEEQRALEALTQKIGGMGLDIDAPSQSQGGQQKKKNRGGMNLGNLSS